MEIIIGWKRTQRENGSIYFGTSSTMKTWSESDTTGSSLQIAKDILGLKSTNGNNGNGNNGASASTTGPATFTNLQVVDNEIVYDDGDVRVLACHYTECRTTDNKHCLFPFRYKGRLFSSCITLDSSDSWCSLNTDENDNHIDDGNSRGECRESCLVQNCPIGFFWQNGNCYHISAMTSIDLVTDSEKAEQVCHEFGSRLYQPRDVFLDGDFFKSQENLVEHIFHSHQSFDPKILLLGAYSENFPVTQEIYYNDGTKAYYLEYKVAEQGGLNSDTISDLSTYTDPACIVMSTSGEFKAEECIGYGETRALGYICEAKPLITIDGPDTGKLCHFPFYTLANSVELHHSCIYNETSRYSWCFTELDEDNVGIPDKTGLCPDEREITYDGPGSGKQCHLPFLYERVWFGKCAMEPEEHIWCPTELSDPELMFNETIDEIGYCTGYLASGGSNCNVNYDFVGGMCIRVSPFPETFEAASLKCKSEGASLLSILDNSVVPPIREHISIVSKKRIEYLPQYSPDLTSYWVGGEIQHSQWIWEGNGKNFSRFTDWVNNKENEGCVLHQCTDNYKLTLQTEKNFAWQAADKSIEKPYICESKCQGGFLWFKRVKKCLKIVSKKEQTSIAEALYQCSQFNSRLLSFETCDQADNLPLDLKFMITQTSDLFWVGLFSNGLENVFPRRITEATKAARPILRSDGYSSVKDCASLADTSGTSPEIAFLTYEKPAVTLTNVGYDSTDKKGYICEQNFDWICPDGYMLFQEDCYKIETNPIKFTDALINCEEAGGMLAEISTAFVQLFIIEMAKQISCTADLWTGYRKDPANFADNPDIIYHSTLDHQVTLPDINGKFNLNCMQTN